MSGRRIPDALLERYLAQALEGEPRARVEALLAESAPDRARLEELRADSAAFLIEHGPGPLVARYEAERKPPAWWRRWPVLLAPALAAAVALGVLWPGEDPYTVKGSVVLALHRKVGETSTRVGPDEPLAPGDAVRFEVRADKDGFVAVLGRDSRGAVTVYHPYGGTQAAPYAAGAPLLPTAIELDDAPGAEDLYALHAPSPFALEVAVRALEAGRPLEKALPSGVSVGRARLTKRTPR